MKKLFLSSSFQDVAGLFAAFANEDLQGKTVAFIPTASIVEEVTFYVDDGRKALQKLGLRVEELEISTATPQEIASKLQGSDFIYVSGGNTFFLLQELQRTGADRIIVDQINRGKLYIGESAGSIIVSPSIDYAGEMDDHEKAPGLTAFDALHIVDWYPLPHHTNEPFREAVEKIIAKYGAERNLYPMSNSQAIAVEGDRIRIFANS